MAAIGESAGGLIEIRAALVHEYDEIARVTERAFGAGPYGHLPVSEERRTLVRDVAARARAGRVLVALGTGGAVLGTVSLLRAGTPQSRLAVGDEAELRLLAVAPNARGLGIGRALAAAAEEEALAWGAPAVVLDTGSENAVAQALYRSLGYTVIGSGEEAVGGERDVSITRIAHVDFRKGIRRDDAVVVRLVREDEYDAVADLSERAYTAEYEISDDYRASIRQIAERAAEHHVWVAVDASDGTLFGAVATPRRGQTISPLARAGELDFRLLAVDPPARGRGIGEILTRHVIELARLRGLEHVVMNSGPQMLGAHRLYEKLGFARMPDREPVIEDGGRSFRLLSFTIPVTDALSSRATAR
jgi:ribosomal protein S18 acetylase RimI-like enzyme